MKKTETNESTCTPAIPKAIHSYCSKGHRVSWYVHKPGQCPYCRTKLLPVERIDRKGLLAT